MSRRPSSSEEARATAGTQPEVTVAQVMAGTHFELSTPDEVGVSEAPTAEELDIVRNEVDRDRLYI